MADPSICKNEVNEFYAAIARVRELNIVPISDSAYKLAFENKPAILEGLISDRHPLINLRNATKCMTEIIGLSETYKEEDATYKKNKDKLLKELEELNIIHTSKMNSIEEKLNSETSSLLEPGEISIAPQDTFRTFRNVFDKDELVELTNGSYGLGYKNGFIKGDRKNWKRDIIALGLGVLTGMTAGLIYTCNLKHYDSKSQYQPKVSQSQKKSDLNKNYIIKKKIESKKINKNKSAEKTQKNEQKLQSNKNKRNIVVHEYDVKDFEGQNE